MKCEDTQTHTTWMPKPWHVKDRTRRQDKTRQDKATLGTHQYNWWRTKTSFVSVGQNHSRRPDIPFCSLIHPCRSRSTHHMQASAVSLIRQNAYFYRRYREVRWGWKVGARQKRASAPHVPSIHPTSLLLIFLSSAFVLFLSYLVVYRFISTCG